MLALLPITVFVLLCLVVHRHVREVRKAFLCGAVMWGVAIVAITELLSLCRAIDALYLSIAWTLVGLAALYFRIARRRPAPVTPQAETASLDWPVWRLLPILAALLIAGALALVGLAAAPNNYDSMTYHMGRVIHWMQNASVRFYPTNIPRQLHQNPLAEFVILHLQILSDSDRLAILVQWFSLVAGAIAVSRIARQLGAGGGGQVVAMLLTITIPMGLLQATNTQNDLVEGLWLVCLASFVLDLRDQPRTTDILAAGAALGLAMLTKGTAYVFAPPLLIWLTISLVRRLHVRRAIPRLLALGAMALALNAGHYARNYDLYASPLGPGQEGKEHEFKYSNDTYRPGAILSNILRNIALQLATPIKPIDHSVENAVTAIHRWIGINPNDPLTTWTSTTFGLAGEGWANENFAPSTFHALLIFAAMITIAIVRPPAGSASARPFVLCLICAFILFCAYLKWQPWHVRLHLPLLMLGCAIVAVVMERTWNRWVGLPLVVIAFAVAAPTVLYNQLHPWTGPNSFFQLARQDQYFMNAAGLRQPYLALAKGVRTLHCGDVGFECGVNDCEYPLWILLHDADPRVRLEHVNVTNSSAAKAASDPRYKSFNPCFTVILDTEHNRISYRVRQN